VSSLTSTANRAIFSREGSAERRHPDAHPVADANIFDVGLWHWNHQPEKIVLRKTDDRQRLRTRTGAGLHQCAEISETLRDNASERRGDLSVIK